VTAEAVQKKMHDFQGHFSRTFQDLKGMLSRTFQVLELS